MSNSLRIITPTGTLSYPHVDQPQPGQNGGDPKYSAAIVFAKGTDLSAARAAAIEALKGKFGAHVKLPNGSAITIEKAFEAGMFKSPFRTDALAKGYPEGSTFINARSNQKPGCVYAHAGVDGKPAPVPDEKVKAEFYAGAQVRASLTAFAYDTSGNKGVSFALNNLQKVGEGERIDGRVSAENEFTADLSSAPVSLEDLGV